MAAKRTFTPTLVCGGIGALGMILFTIGMYKSGIQAFIGPVVYLMYLIPLACGIIAAAIERKRDGGFLEFRSALRIIFGILVAGMALQAVFNWFLVHVIDPHFGRVLNTAILEKMEQTYRRFGMPEDQIRRNIDPQKGTDSFTFGKMFFGLALYSIVGFLISLILSAIVKRKAPMERPTTTQ